jgi:hypothetical protein
MATVNYFILGQLFGLLERIELIDGVDFFTFDPDDPMDVSRIARNYLKPPIEAASSENREAIKLTIAFYSQNDAAPCQLMKDRHQELTLPDSGSWPTFFHRVGLAVFGSIYREQCRLTIIEETPSEAASESILRG